MVLTAITMLLILRKEESKSIQQRYEQIVLEIKEQSRASQRKVDEASVHIATLSMMNGELQAQMEEEKKVLAIISFFTPLFCP